MLLLRQVRFDPDDRGLADIGTHVRDPFDLAQQVHKARVRIYIAFALAHPYQMIFLQRSDQIKQNILQRLYAQGRLQTSLFEGDGCVFEDLLRQFIYDADLRDRCPGKAAARSRPRPARPSCEANEEEPRNHGAMHIPVRPRH